MNKNIDKELNVRLYESDRSALGEIFELYWDKFFQIAFNILKNEDDAKDAVQVVLIDIWKRRSERIILNIEAYLHNAVKFQVFKKLRDGKLNQQHVEKFEKILVQEPIENKIEFDELNEDILKSIEKLPDKCREVIKLSRYEGLSHKEIASKLEISVKTVENHITKALKVIRSALPK